MTAERIGVQVGGLVTERPSVGEMKRRWGHLKVNRQLESEN